jgi:carboxymethylenebutenolidase
MPHDTVSISTRDGECECSLHIPAREGPWPTVIMYPDAGGLRDAFRTMGDKLASLGHVTLVPDIYYRHGGFEPFDMRTVFTDREERDRIVSLMKTVTAEMSASDAQSFADYLVSLPQSKRTAVGTTGYCMGGRTSLIVAGALGQRIAAAASFHGGNLAGDDPESPHHRARDITATVYVAGAANDGSFPAEQQELLEKCLTEAEVDHTIDIYPAAHGFAVPDTPVYDATSYQRHWDALDQLYTRATWTR